VNLKNSFTGAYPTGGAHMLLKANLPVLDLIAEESVSRVQPGDELEVAGDRLYLGSALLASGRRLSLEWWEELWAEAQGRWRGRYQEWNRQVFKDQEREMPFWLEEPELPLLAAILFNKEVVLVGRGLSYIQDIQGLKPYIKQRKPVLIGIEDGADALWEFGFRPDIILGDLTEVSKKAMSAGAEIVFHPQGNDFSGMDRVQSLGIIPELFHTPLTNEDAGIFLAYLYGARVIISAGFTVKPFQPGGLWLRQLTAGRVVPAGGAAQLYTPNWLVRQWLPLMLAGVFPLLALLLLWLG
jgi:uncharacterized membrane-anchored protein